jgi:hypothetical protein
MHFFVLLIAQFEISILYIVGGLFLFSCFGTRMRRDSGGCGACKSSAQISVSRKFLHNEWILCSSFPTFLQKKNLHYATALLLSVFLHYHEAILVSAFLTAIGSIGSAQLKLETKNTICPNSFPRFPAEWHVLHSFEDHCSKTRRNPVGESIFQKFN